MGHWLEDVVARTEIHRGPVAQDQNLVDGLQHLRSVRDDNNRYSPCFQPLERLHESPITLGILFGLVFGKVIGIVVATWIAVTTGLGSLPAR